MGVVWYSYIPFNTSNMILSKKNFWKSWHHRGTVAENSLRQKIAITINFFYRLILTTRWGTIHTITQPVTIESKKNHRG